MNILGISALYHDAAACLVVDGEIIAAAQEERFTRKKHDASFPQHALKYCLHAAGLHPSAVDYAVFYDKPLLKLERILATYLAFAPRGFGTFRRAMAAWLGDKLQQKKGLARNLRALWPADIDWSERLLFSEHHLSHAASAFYPSPFAEAAVLTVDGVGEWATTSVAVGRGSDLSVVREIHFPHSLGLLYSAVTHYTGFRVNSGEYKVMGLAPYGEPRYASRIRDHLLDLKDDGSFALDMSYFDFCVHSTMTNEKFHCLFGGPPRAPEGPLTQRDLDMAASIQLVIEEALLNLARSAARITGQRNLCLGGGVALNCVANGKLLRAGVFDQLWVQPAAGDAGGAIGAALAVHHLMLGNARSTNADADAMKGAYLGPSYSDADVHARLSAVGAVFDTHGEEQLIAIAAQALADGKAVGWHHGRMEFGQRALGARSILADPRAPRAQELLNLKIKYRESFRPFAPSVLREDVTEWFDMDVDSPYMTLVADVASSRRTAVTQAQRLLAGIDKRSVVRSTIPAVTHVDYSARVQTVHKQTNPRYHKLLTRFKEMTGCPLLINTSFNVRGEPIVLTPEDAYRCFMGTDIDLLIVGNCVMQKSAQRSTAHDYWKEFDRD